MKIMFASDIHGDYKCACETLDKYREEKAEKLILLGDILYHGPRNDLPKGYAPKKVIELLNSVKAELKDGVLTITFEKEKTEAPKKIEIQ